MLIHKTRSLRPAMTIVNTNISSRRRRENLTLILKTRISLNNSDRVITRGMRLQFRVPEQSITAPPAKKPLERPETRPQHHGFQLKSQSKSEYDQKMEESEEMKIWDLMGMFEYEMGIVEI